VGTSVANTVNGFIKSNVDFTTASDWLDVMGLQTKPVTLN